MERDARLSSQARLRYIFATWRACAARRFRIAQRWTSMSGEAVAKLWDAVDSRQNIMGVLRVRRAHGGGFVLREVAETQVCSSAVCFAMQLTVPCYAT